MIPTHIFKTVFNIIWYFFSANKKQFGFQKWHSTENAILQLVDQISNSFENNLFTLDVLIDLSKAFDTIDQDIFICKLKN